MPQAHTRHHHHPELAELVWFACLEATDVPYALTANLLAYHSYATCCQQIHTFAQGCWQPSAFTSRLLAGHKDWCILPAASRRHTMLLDGRANRAMQPAV